MSQQPYPYGHYAGHQTQEPYQYSSAPVQAAPGLIYGLPQEPNPTAVAGNLASANGSLDYNGNNIPGLGIGGGGPPIVPTYHPKRGNIWPQNTYGVVSSGTAPLHNQEQGIVGLGKQHISNIPARSSGLAPHISANRPNVDALEEGELSEGEFEDLYEPKGSDETIEDIPQQSLQPQGIVVDLSGSVGDADGSSIYDTGSAQDEAPVGSTPASLPAVDEEEEYSPGEYYEPEYPPRERSGSYSPYLSPREIQPENSVKDTPRETKQIPSLQETLQASFTRPNASVKHQPVDISLPTNPPLPGQTPQNPLPSAKTHTNQSTNHSNKSEVDSSLQLSYKSVSEAKKKAQEAILGLWPLKVRYHDYLEEGIDAQVIKPLFTDLGLDTSPQKTVTSIPDLVGFKSTSPKAGTSAPKPPGGEISPSKLSMDSQPKSSVLATVDVSKSTLPSTSKPSAIPEATKSSPDKSGSKIDTKNTNKSAQEERKDRIARMLAEKSKKSALTIPTPALAVPSSTPPVVSTSTPEQTESIKAKTRAENTMKLQQKLNALRKAQEEAEVKKKQDITKQANSTTVSGAETMVQPAAHHAVPAQEPVEQESSSAEPDASPALASIPGLSVVSTSQSNFNNRSLKRPVASDFDSYTPPVGSIKRTRTQETLIIDVSDDEDVEMDLGSPTEGPSSTIQNNTSLARQNSLAALPPLTSSHSWRGRRSSPITSAVGTPSEHGHKLDFLTQQIEEAKRKIAEAEAKKAIKRANGTLTPLGQSPAPASGEKMAMRLPKVTEGAKNERRERIASFQLPLIEAALREKQEKLARLQSEAAQLELEVKASIAERQKLTVEMEELSDDAESEFKPDESSGPKELSEPDATGIPQLVQPVSNVVAASPQIPVALDNTAIATRQRSDALDDSPPILQQSPTNHEDTQSSSERADMDIDSPESSTDNETPNAGAALDAATSTSCITRPSISSPSLLPENKTPTAEISHDKNETKIFESSTNDSEVIAEATKDQSRDHGSVVADVSMENSDTELLPVGEDPHEPMPAQISNSDRIRLSEDEDGEILEEDPYEPGSAIQGSDVNSQKVSELLTYETEKRPTISPEELLSYRSPLRYFHAYRFHPNFLNDVRGGLKSMTYSSRIDVSRPLCPSLVNGGQCPNGPNCEFQHFDNMVLSDTDIIAQLGSTDMYTGEQKGRFIDGLKKVLNDLKANKVRDFDRITKAIVQYRANFLDDKSKILPLGHVTI